MEHITTKSLSVILLARLLGFGLINYLIIRSVDDSKEHVDEVDDDDDFKEECEQRAGELVLFRQFRGVDSRLNAGNNGHVRNPETPELHRRFGKSKVARMSESQQQDEEHKEEEQQLHAPPCEGVGEELDARVALEVLEKLEPQQEGVDTQEATLDCEQVHQLLDGVVFCGGHGV